MLVDPDKMKGSIDNVAPGGKYPMLKLAMHCEMKEVAIH